MLHVLASQPLSCSLTKFALWPRPLLLVDEDKSEMVERAAAADYEMMWNNAIVIAPFSLSSAGNVFANFDLTEHCIQQHL